MAHTRTWDETDPADGDQAKNLGQELREFKVDVRERMEISFDWQSTGTGGEAKQIRMQEGLAPTLAANIGFLYLKDVSGATELFYMDDSGNEAQLSNGGLGRGDPITTQGDVVRGDSSGVAERLALGAAGLVLGSDATDAAWRVSAFPTDWVAKLDIAVGTDTAHDVDVSVFNCRDKDDSINIISAAALTKQIDATWAAGSAVGGMDESLDPIAGTGAKTYFVHALSDTQADGESNAEDVGIDDVQNASKILADSVVVAASLVKARLIGLIRTDASDNIESIAYKMGDGRWHWVSGMYSPPASAGTQSLTNPFTPLPTRMWAEVIVDASIAGFVAGDKIYQDVGIDNNGAAETGLVLWATAAGAIGVSHESDVILIGKTGSGVTGFGTENFNLRLHAIFAADAI